jgi:hypothetical protein
MDPLGQHASCVLGHCAENNLCRPPHAVGRHNMPAAPTSTHIQGVFDFSGTELGQTAVPPVSCGLSFSLPFPQQPPPPLLFFSSHMPNSLACFFTWTSRQAGGAPLPAPPSPRTSSQPPWQAFPCSSPAEQRCPSSTPCCCSPSLWRSRPAASKCAPSLVVASFFCSSSFL